MYIISNNFLNPINNIFPFKKSILSDLVSRQKQITLLAVATLGCLACFIFYRCMQNRKVNKPHVQKRKLRQSKKRSINKKEQGYVEGKTIHLALRTLDGKTSSYQVSTSDTILSFKQLIAQREHCSLDKIRLVWAGRALEDDKTFEDYQISNNNIILRILPLGG